MNNEFITNQGDFDSLPIGTVIRDRLGGIYEKVSPEISAHRGWTQTGSELDVHPMEFVLPARVLYNPEDNK